MAERLTLDEVIVYEKESAKDHREKAEYQKNRGVKGRQIDIHIEAETKKAEWREQLAEWLEELKHYKDLEESGRLITLPEDMDLKKLIKCTDGDGLCPRDVGLTDRCELSCLECWLAALKGCDNK